MSAPEFETKLDYALYLASLGFYVFPCVEGSKLPLISKFTEKATRDPDQIKKWWTDPVLNLTNDYNIAIATSKYHGSDGIQKALLVVDVDIRPTKRGDHEIVKLEAAGCEFPPTVEQDTPSGGRHFVYVVDAAVKQGANVFGPGLDVRSSGGYILGHGSTTGQGRYALRGDRLTPTSAPTWCSERCGSPSAARPGIDAAPSVSVDQDRAVLRAVDYLTKHAPVAVEGNSGDTTTYAVACRVKDFGVDLPTAVDLLSSQWNDRCQPPWSPDELTTKVENAYRYGNMPPGSDAPEVQFDIVATPTSAAPAPTGSPVEIINKDHALIYVEGSAFVLHETVDEKGRPKRVFLTEQTFKRKYSPYTTQRGRGRVTTWAEDWLDWPRRREYVGLCFAPEREPRHGYYNLWRGFSCAPVAYEQASTEARRGFDTWMEHLRHNVCQGNPELETWLLTYFAHMIQRPWERPLTTLVFRGEKGVGKNASIDRVGTILGGAPHHLTAHDSRYLTSNFNGHLDSCLCLVLDEAFWSGNKDAESRLKGLTTAPEIMIERKGKEPYMVDNLVRIVVIGNEDWLVPATNDERRWAVFDVNAGRKQDTKYFEQMRLDIDERGGAAVLLHFLKNFDLRKANVNVAPKTAALLDQKHASLDPLEQWWLDCISAGYVVGSDFGAEWPTVIQADRFRSALRRYITDRNVRARIGGDIAIGRALKKVAPGITKRRMREGQDLMYVYEIPTLADCRAAWCKFIGQDVSWGKE